ncbi:MAG: ATP-binding protein [Eubacterium sp.]|nr:ATP-binding protein [Eubacterium sp.]
MRLAIKRYSEKKLESYQNDLLQKHYNEVENMYRQMRGWRHDYKNHIATMKIHLEQGNYKLLGNYLNELNKDLTTVDTVLKTGNVMVDAILNSKISLAQSKDIHIDATAAVPEKIRVSDTDICVIIGNLLDNAIEACCKLEDSDKRFIRIYIGLLKQQLYISISNSVGGEIKKEGKIYFTTKNENHGFGLKRIDKIVSKYGGYINRQDETDVFATEIMISL